MKIRSTFVSNSSSTSFIVALPKDTRGPCECCGRPFPNFLDAVKGSGDYETRLHLRTTDKRTLLKGIRDQWNLYPDDAYKWYDNPEQAERARKEIADEVKEFEKILEEVEDGSEMAFLDIGYHDESLRHFRDLFPEVKILYTDH